MFAGESQADRARYGVLKVGGPSIWDFNNFQPLNTRIGHPKGLEPIPISNKYSLDPSD